MFRDAKDTIASATLLYNANTTLTEIGGGSAASAYDLKAASALGSADPMYLNIHLSGTAYSVGANSGGVYFAVVTKATVDVSSGATEIARFLLATADLVPGKVHSFPFSTKQALRYLGVLVAPVTASATTAATATVWFSVNPETALQ
jgi:hypothetical protein